VRIKKVFILLSNSLLTAQTTPYVDEVMDDWAKSAVEGHFYAENHGGIITSVLRR
jgi:kynureninase